MVGVDDDDDFGEQPRLTDRRLVELRRGAMGTRTRAYFLHKIENARLSSDEYTLATNLKYLALLDGIEQEEALEHERLKAVTPANSELFGAIAGIGIEPDSYDLGGGILIRKAFAHVFASYLMAFVPAKPGRPHPGPWKSAGAGVGFDVQAEIHVPLSYQPVGFDRLNTVWWLVSLMRLLQAGGQSIPVISDTSFSSFLNNTHEPSIWPIELFGMQRDFDDRARNPIISTTTLDWVFAHHEPGAAMMSIEHFDLAFNAFANAYSANTLGTAKLLLWSALVALFRPGRSDITKRLSSSIATYLFEDPSIRDREYQVIRDLYESRGGTIHAAKEPQFQDVSMVFRLARSSFKKSIEQRVVPDMAALQEQWRTRS